MNTDRLRSEAAPTLTVRTSWGDILVAARNGKIISCDLPDLHHLEKSATEVSSDWKKFELRGSRMSNAGASADSRALVAADHFIRALFAGDSADLPPVELPAATTFTRSVWNRLLKIPFGKALNYGQIARAAGHPRAARAAGSACGANQIPLFVPCHRVLAAGGKLGGFSSGLAWKKLLLRCEGIAP